MKNIPAWRRTAPMAALCLICLIGLGLRLFRLGQQGLFLDEAWSWAVAGLPLAQIWDLPRLDPHPVFYYFVLKGFLVFAPASEAGLRSLSVLFSAAALLATMRYLARRWSPAAALAGGWLLALSSFDVYYAQDARMYTLLALLWLLSSLRLMGAAPDDRAAALGWMLSVLPLGWTHYYGLVIAAFQLAGLAGLALWRWRRLPPTWLLASVVIVLAGLLPAAGQALPALGQTAGGAWTPVPADLLDLFNLAAVGLTAARSRFLDAPGLILPALTSVSPGGWSLAGMAVAGAPAVYGLRCALRQGSERRTQALLAIGLTLAPVAAVFGYACLAQRPAWALKAFLGAAYMLYVWAGVGLGQLRWPWLRLAAACLALAISMASLGPYFTVWQKSDAARALRSLPAEDAPGLVVASPGYLAPLILYYLGSQTQVWELEPAGQPGLARVSGAGTQLADCQDAEVRAAKSIWVYGAPDPIRQAARAWPECLAHKPLWIFEAGHWTQVSP